MATIVLTGATGNLGSAVLKHLLTLLPPSRIIVSVYNSSHKKAEAIAKTGVTVRQGDYTDPDSLDKAFAGANILFLVSSPSFNDELRIRSHRNAIEAAKRQGIQRIVYTSLAFGDNSTAWVTNAHLATEAILKSSGVAYTIIREGVYIEAWPLFVGFYTKGARDLYVAGDGPIAWADRDNLAEGNAKVLAAIATDQRAFENETLIFTGAKAYTLEETVKIVSSIVGEEVNLHIVSEKEYIERHPDKEAVVKAWVSTYPWLGTGAVGVVDPSLEKVVGRPLISLEERLKQLLTAQAETAEMANWVGNGLRT